MIDCLDYDDDAGDIQIDYNDDSDHNFNDDENYDDDHDCDLDIMIMMMMMGIKRFKIWAEALWSAVGPMMH